MAKTVKFDPVASRVDPVASVTHREPSEAPRISSRALLGTAHELLIEHGDALYRLRATRNGKLILTK